MSPTVTGSKLDNLMAKRTSLSTSYSLTLKVKMTMEMAPMKPRSSIEDISSNSVEIIVEVLIIELFNPHGWDSSFPSLCCPSESQHQGAGRNQ